MKIAITSTGKELTSEMDQYFGRAVNFLMVNPDTMDFEVIKNNSVGLLKGAGIQAGKIIVDNKVNVVITGNCGPKAFNVLNTAGIEVITGVKGRVMDAIEDYKRGNLKTSEKSNVKCQLL